MKYVLGYNFEIVDAPNMCLEKTQVSLSLLFFPHTSFYDTQRDKKKKLLLMQSYVAMLFYSLVTVVEVKVVKDFIT